MIKIVNEALVTDYMSSDDLHSAMQNPEFGDFSQYQQMDGMIVRTDKPQSEFPGAKGLVKSRYWKFVKQDEDGFEVYEVSRNGDKLGDPFHVEGQLISNDQKEEEESLSEDWRDGKFTKEDLDEYFKDTDERVGVVYLSLTEMAKKHPEFYDEFVNEVKSIRDKFDNLQSYLESHKNEFSK